MSLADQSQQWFPTSAQVTVLQARGLRIKGKNGTNDAYAIMQVAKDKCSTSVAEKSVTPMWKEQASFDLPTVHHGNAERCTLRVHVMHRALVGPDKPLGQAVVNLLELHEVKSRNKTEWFKLLDKAGKADKERGEVLLDIQFMRNNMTASMFDLSGTDKSRSRLGKFKDKLRGKKKDGGAGMDSVSAIVPSSFSQVLTDSEGEEDAAGVEGAASEKNGKKKLKLKSLFSHKSNLQKNMSQSMSFLGPLPERNQTLSGSRSSGLNVEASEGKKKFKFGIHKRSGSNDSKTSQASSSVPDPAQRGGPDAARPGSHVGGGHVYTEEPTARAGSRASSNFSLSSSGRGSMEDLHRGPGGSVEGSFSSYDSLRVSRPQSSTWRGNKATEEEVEVEEEEEEEELDVSEYERSRMKEEEEKARQEEQMRIERRREEEEQRKRLDEERLRREEMEKREIEEQRRKYQRDEEDRIRREREEEERFRREEEMARIEDRRKEEEGKRREVEEERERIRMMEEERKVQEEEEKFRLKEEMERIEKERLGREEKERWEEEQTRMKKEEEEKKKRECEEKLERIRIEKEKERLEEEYARERVRMEKEREEEEKRVREEEERMSEMQEREERRLRESELEEERFRMEKEREEEERRVRKEKERMIEMQEREEKRQRESELEEERFRMEKKREEERMSEMQEREERRLRESELEEERFRVEKKREEEDRRVSEEEEEEEERMSEMQGREERRLRERDGEEERFRMEKEREEERRAEEETTRIEKARKRQEEERILMEEEEKRRREVAEEQEDKRQEESERMRREESLLEEERIKRKDQERREEEERERVKEQQRWEDKRRESEEEGYELEEEFMTKAQMKNTPFDLHKSYLGPNFALTNKSPGAPTGVIESARRRGPVRSTPPSEDDDPRTPDGPFNSQTADVPTARQSPASRRTPPLLFVPTNPFFEASESEYEEQLSGKKRRAPLPPSNQEFPHDKPCDPSAAVPTVPSVSPLGGVKTNLHLDECSDDEKDSPPAACTAPQPSKQHGPQIEQIASKERSIQRVHANKTCDAPQPSKKTKGPAPAKPNPNRTRVSAQIDDGRPEHAQRTALSFKDNWKDSNIPSGPHTVTEQRPSTYGTNPFDEDEDDDDDAGIHPADQEELTPGTFCPPTSSAMIISPKHLSGGEAQTPVDADESSSSKMRSLKTVRAPPPPEDKGSSPVKPSRNVYSDTQDTVSSSARPVGLPPTGDTSETRPTVQPRRTEATAEQEGRVETATRPASVRLETGAGPASPSQRSLPVKPLRASEQQSAISSVSTWTGNPPSEIHRAGRDAVEVKEDEARGPFSQLTRGELLLLLQKLQSQLTQRDHKISELEQYIDNLLVRIMEEEPSILMSMNALKH